MTVTVLPTPLPEVLVVQPRVFEDARGFFMESYNEADFADIGVRQPFVQDNHSRSGQGVLRGLHYQDARAPLAKLVRCTLGRILDVAVDIRAGSPTVGRWVAQELTAENKLQLFCPVGFAHGFLTLSEVAEVQYKCTGYYRPDTEGALRWDDPDLAIAWPEGVEPTQSARDAAAQSLRAYLTNPAFHYGEVPPS